MPTQGIRLATKHAQDSLRSKASRVFWLAPGDARRLSAEALREAPLPAGDPASQAPGSRDSPPPYPTCAGSLVWSGPGLSVTARHGAAGSTCPPQPVSNNSVWISGSRLWSSELFEGAVRSRYDVLASHILSSFEVAMADRTLLHCRVWSGPV